MAELNSRIFEGFVKKFYREKVTDKDLEAFRQRVFSFIEEQKWVSRSQILSPLICARYGWRCASANMLKCVSCGAKISTKEPKMEIYCAYKSCINKIAADLKDGHKAHCPWPLSPSPESFVKMVLLPKEEAFSQFSSRLKSCLDFTNSIPQVADSVSTELGLRQDDVISLCRNANIPTEDVDLIGMSGVCLAATGWTLISEKNGVMKTYIKCDSCQRLIWAKSFNLVNAPSSESTSTKNEKDSEVESPSTEENVRNCDKNSSIEEGPKTNTKEHSNKRSMEDTTSEKAVKKFKLDRRDFNPLEEHRPWCCWVSITEAENLSPVKEDDDKKDNSPANDDNNKKEVKDDKKTDLICMPGWKLFVKSLMRNIPMVDDSSPKNTPSRNRVRSVRDLLESWTSPSLLEDC